MNFKTITCGTIAISAALTSAFAGGGGSHSYGGGTIGKAGSPGIGAIPSSGATSATTSAVAGLGLGALDSIGAGLETALKPIWDIPTIYTGDGLVKEVGFHGRYQGQYYYADGPAGTDSGYETRRSRLGFHTELNNGLEFDVTWNVELDDEIAFDSIDSGGIFGEFAGLDFGIGKLKPKITAEYSTSSKRILTFERSLLVNQVTPDKTGGLFIGGETGAIDWDLYGLFGGSEGDQGLPTTDGGFNVLGRLAYQACENSELHLHYLRHEGDADNEAFANYDNTISVGSTYTTDAGGMITDVIYATGEDDTSDVYGIIVMPYYDLSDRLRLVLRGQYAASEGDDGIRLQKRYERKVDDGDRGDSYWAAYLGLNYYVMGDKLKIMNGIEYSDLSGGDSFDGFTFFTGVRLYF